VFDRSMDIARVGDRTIEPTARLVVVEGNYLLLDDPEREQRRSFLEPAVLQDAPDAVREARLRARRAGLKRAPDEIRAKLEDNDLPNARSVIRSPASACSELLCPFAPAGGPGCSTAG